MSSSNEQKILEVVLELRDKLSPGMKRVTNQAKSNTSAFTGLGKAVVGLTTAFLAFQGTRVAINFLKESIIAGAESEAIYARLNAALQNNAGFTQQSAAAVSAYNQQLSQRLSLDDEALNSVSAQIASLTELSASAIPAATLATAGLAAKLGIELPAAGMQMARFLSGATDKLRGTTLEVEKGADANTRMAAAIKFTEEALRQQEAIAATTKGQLDLLAINWNNLKEAIGGAANSSPAMTEALQRLNQALVDIQPAAIKATTDLADGVGRLLEKFNNMTPAQQGFTLKVLAGTAAVVAAAPALTGLTTALGTTAKAFGALPPPVLLVVGAIASVGGAIKELWPQLQSNLAQMGTAWEGFKNKVLSAIGGITVEDGGIAGLISGWKEGAGIISDSLSAMGSAFESFKTRVSNAVSGTVNKIIELWNMAADVLHRHSIIPDMNAAIEESFRRNGENVKAIVADLTANVIDKFGLTKKESSKAVKELTKEVEDHFKSARMQEAVDAYVGVITTSFNKLFQYTLPNVMDSLPAWMKRVLTGESSIGGAADALAAKFSQSSGTTVGDANGIQALLDNTAGLSIIDLRLQALTKSMDYLGSIGISSSMSGDAWGMGGAFNSNFQYSRWGLESKSKKGEVYQNSTGMWCTDSQCGFSSQAEAEASLGGKKGGGGQQQAVQKSYDIASGIFNQQLGQALASGILTHNWQPVGQALAQNLSQTMQQLFAGAGPMGGLLGGLAGGLLGGLVTKLFGGGKSQGSQRGTYSNPLIVRDISGEDMATRLLAGIKSLLIQQSGGGLTSIGNQVRMQNARLGVR